MQAISVSLLPVAGLTYASYVHGDPNIKAHVLPALGVRCLFWDNPLEK